MTRINLARDRTPPMHPPPNRPPRALFTVRDSDRFPGDLWRRFRAVCAARGTPWIDALRELIEGYIKRHNSEKGYADDPTVPPETK